MNTSSQRSKAPARRLLKTARWLALAPALIAVWACNSRTLEQPTATPTQSFNSTFQETLNKDIDIVFMIDDSLSMAPLLNKLATNFPAFISVFQSLPSGLPNIHLAVVSQDLGAGQWTGIPQCPVGGDGGQFHDQVGAGTASSGMPCTSTGLNPGQHFISSVNGMTNFDTTMGISKVFACIANLGQGGCGFEHQIQSVVRALGADPAFPLPTNNVGFLRPSAYLAIIMVTNEDDDSAPPVTPLFDTSSRSIADPYGPLQSYRANEFGHLCNGMKPPRTMPASFPPGACVSAEDQGLLIPLHTMIDEIKALKTDPSQIFVAAIAGPPDPYNVIMVPAAAGTSDAQAGIMWPNIAHSCMENSGEYGDPSIRLAQFVEAFGRNGVFESICADTFAPALMTIAKTIGQVLGQQCVQGQLVDKDGDPTNGLQPDCTVVDHAYDAMGNTIDTVIPSCDDSPTAPKCWKLVDDATKCPSTAAMPQKVLTFVPPPDPTQSNLNASVSCAICISGVTSKGCP
jgi:hypothetical protein